MAAALATTAASVWFVQGHTAPPVQRSTGEVGSLVYTALDPSGQTRLYRWDLLANVVHRGPIVHDLVGLFDASAAHPGWVGETSTSPSGGVDIGVFKFLGPQDQALPLGHGDMAAWAPHGPDAVVVTSRPAPNGCSRLFVMKIHLSPLQQDPIGGERTCATVQGVQLGPRVTFLSLRGPTKSRIVFLSIGRLRTILDGYTLASLSRSNDMVITPDPVNTDAAAGDPSPVGAALYFRGPDAQAPTPFTAGVTPFVLDRVLAWAPDATEALAIGTSADGTGFYRVVGAPPRGKTQPITYVGSAKGFSTGVYTGVGTRLLFSGGEFIRVYDGSSSTLPLPAGAPTPTGPMVWIGS